MDSDHFYRKTWDKAFALKKEDKFIDFKIILSDGTEYGIHKMVLLTRSKKMLKVLEDNPRLTSIEFPKEFDPELSKTVLDYLYTAKINLTLQNVFKYLDIFYYLDAIDILELDIHFYRKFITTDNILSFKKMISSKSNPHINVIPELELLVDSYILKHMKELYIHSSFKKLEIEDLEYYLESDNLNFEETLLIKLIDDWVNIDDAMIREIRCEESERLYSKIRFALFEENNLLALRDEHFIISHKESIKTLIDEAIEYRKHPNTQHIKQTDLTKFRVSEENDFIGGGINIENKKLVKNIYKLESNKFIKNSIEFTLGTAFSQVVIKDNYIYNLGGYEVNSEEKANLPTNKVRVFNYQLKAWVELSPMFSSKIKFTATLIGDSIYVIGGEDENRNHSNTVERYDIRKNMWSVETKLPFTLSSHTAELYGGMIYLFGGIKNENEISADVLKYNPKNKTITTVCTMSHSRHGHNNFRMNTSEVALLRGWDGGIDGSQFQKYVTAFRFGSEDSYDAAYPLGFKTNDSVIFNTEKGLLFLDGWNFKLNQDNSKSYLVDLDFENKIKFKNGPVQPFNASGSAYFRLKLPYSYDVKK
ncbi:kelch-like protein [Carp edema virus]|nr:kelch-like protein [Carp edema virus]